MPVTEVEMYLYAALFFTMTGYAFYWFALKRELVRPNRFSWLIWSAVTTVEALTYQAVNEGLVQNLIFMVSAASCLFLTIAIWRDSSGARPSRTEIFSMAVALVALVLWIGFNSTVWAHLLVVAAVPISFLPTWISAGEDKRREMSPAWGFWALGDLAALLLVVRAGVSDPMELPYVVVELVCHAAIWLRIGLGSINPFKALASPNSLIEEHNLCGHPASAFKVEENDKGKAVHVTRPFAKGVRLMEFSGVRYHRSEVHVHRSGDEDRFLQIGPETYLGPSGQLDDLVNHSCEPNCGLQFDADRIFLVTLKPVQAGEELSWDYSTTSSSSHFSMRCCCGSEQCRDVIGDFEFLDETLQAEYRSLELVPPYLRSPGAGERLAA